MSDLARTLLVIFIVLLGNGQQGITGFGSNVLALPFVILLLGLDRAVPLLVTQGWLLAILMVIESRRFIDWREYKRIVLLACAGLPVGIWLAHALPERALRWALVIFMGGVGIEGLARGPACPHAGNGESRGPACPHAGGADDARVGTRAPTRDETPARWLQCLIPIGGIMQGAFGTGGPLTVVYADRVLRDKSVFRATLSMLWLTLNSILVATFFATGRMDHEQLWLNLLCLPGTLAGMWIGTHTHYRLNERAFRLSVYAVLTIAAGVLAWSLLK